MKKSFIACLVVLLSSLLHFLAAQTTSPADSLPDQEADFFQSTTIFQKISRDSFSEVIIQTNFDSLIENKKLIAKEYPGTVLFKNGAGESFKLKVKVEVRGRYRRKVCSMPPLKINFPKKKLAKMGLYPGCDKLKLVTHCNDTEDSDQVLMKEFWSYRLYNQITPQSFKVFPLRITYVNENQPDDRIERYGFIIENNEEMALRQKGEIVERFGTTPDKLDRQSYHNTLMFQYMIGNVDWNILFNRNIKFVQTKKDSQLIVVPYDFDYSGLVKAPHARLNPDLNQKKLEDRFCLGHFSSQEELMQTVRDFKTQQGMGFQCFKDCRILDRSFKKKMDKYLKSFYAILEDEKKLRKIFLQHN